MDQQDLWRRRRLVADGRNGVVYVGSNDDKMYAMNAATGAVRWAVTPEATSIVAGGANGWSTSARRPQGVRVERDDRRVLWSVRPAVSSARPGGRERLRLRRLIRRQGVRVERDRPAQVHWTLSTRRVVSSPAVANGVVYVGSGDSKVYALNAATGAILWTVCTGGPVTSSPAVVNGVVYIGSWDKHVYALKRDEWRGCLDHHHRGRRRLVASGRERRSATPARPTRTCTRSVCAEATQRDIVTSVAGVRGGAKGVAALLGRARGDIPLCGVRAHAEHLEAHRGR